MKMLWPWRELNRLQAIIETQREKLELDRLGFEFYKTETRATIQRYEKGHEIANGVIQALDKRDAEKEVLINRYKEEVEGFRKSLEIKPPILPNQVYGPGEYVYRARSADGREIKIVIDASSKSDAKEKAKAVLNPEVWKSIDLYKVEAA